MDSELKDIFIGRIIQQKVDEKGMQYAEFARRINMARTSLYYLFNAKSIDVERLFSYQKFSDTILSQRYTSTIALAITRRRHSFISQ